MESATLDDRIEAEEAYDSDRSEYRKEDRDTLDDSEPRNYKAESDEGIARHRLKNGKTITTYKGKRIFGEGGSIDDYVDRGAVAIIYGKNPDTGEIEFYMEEKNKAHPYLAGKLSFIGGQVDPKDYSSQAALAREITEEVKDENAQNILIRTLEKGVGNHKVIKDYGPGGKFEVTIYEIKVPSADWKTVKQSQLTHDAGPRRILTIEDIIRKNNDEFVYPYGGVLKEFAYQKQAQQYSGRYKNPSYNSTLLSMPNALGNAQKPLNFVFIYN